jgi:hypothetical protein
MNTYFVALLAGYIRYCSIKELLLISCCLHSVFIPSLPCQPIIRSLQDSPLPNTAVLHHVIVFASSVVSSAKRVIFIL